MSSIVHSGPDVEQEISVTLNLASVHIVGCSLDVDAGVFVLFCSPLLILAYLAMK